MSVISAGTPPRLHSLDHIMEGQCSPEEFIHPSLRVIPNTNQVRWLQTILRNKDTEHGDFVFHADRLIRLVIEEALNFLPTSDKNIVTPGGSKYEGKCFQKGSCGVSLVRSGEAMEKSLRECCRSIRIGKMLIRRQDPDNKDKPKVIYVRLPPDIAERNVLLMYPLMNTGGTIHQSIVELLKNNVPESNIIICTLFVTPDALALLQKSFPDVRILTTEINHDCALHFGERYFGTDI